jgi:CCR4-NOT transcription complex subunit 3
MEKFKAVEKAMKTKAYSKEGLSAAAKLDPKEQAKMEASEFLSNMVDDLEQQIESLEAESESIQATVKKGKAHGQKADRMAAIERIIERHKWHQGKLELIRRSLENGGVEAEQVTDLEESIRYYVTDGMQDDFMEDDTMYDDLSLEEEEDAYGMNQENDKGSSQDTQSVQDDVPEVELRTTSTGKQRAAGEAVPASSGRRPSAQMKSPLPTLATVHNPLPPASNGAPGNSSMKPASVPTRPAGEGLKYASAAAAAAANDKNNVGIAPLPPPPSGTPNSGITPLPSAQIKTSTTSSPSTTSIQLASQGIGALVEKSPTPVPAPAQATPSSFMAASLVLGSTAKDEPVKAVLAKGKTSEIRDSSTGMCLRFLPVLGKLLSLHSRSTERSFHPNKIRHRRKRRRVHISPTCIIAGSGRLIRNLDEATGTLRLGSGTKNATCFGGDKAGSRGLGCTTELLPRHPISFHSTISPGPAHYLGGSSTLLSHRTRHTFLRILLQAGNIPAILGS